jgi:chromosome segregation ATPase
VNKLRDQIESHRDSFKNSAKSDDTDFDEYKTATDALLKNYKNQIDDLEAKNEDLSAKYDNVQHKMNNTNDHENSSVVKDLNRDIEILENSERSLKSTVSELESRIESLMEEKLDRERNYQDSQSEVKGKFKQLETQFNQASAKLKDREEKLKIAETKITNIEEEKLYQMSNEEQQREQLRFEFKSDLDDLHAKITELENQNDELLIEKDLLTQQFKQEQSSNMNSDNILEGNERMLSQIQKLQTQVMDKEKQIIVLQSETTETTSKPKGTNASKRDQNKDRQLAELGVENEFLTKQVEELQSRIKRIEKLERSESESSADDGFLTNLSQGNNAESIAQLRRENKDLTSELIKYKTQFAELEQTRDIKLKDRNEKLKKFSTELTKYEFEMVKAKQSLGEALNSNIELDQYNAELIENIDMLKAQIQDLSKKPDKKKKK